MIIFRVCCGSGILRDRARNGSSVKNMKFTKKAVLTALLTFIIIVATACGGAGEKTVGGDVDSTVSNGGKLDKSENQSAKAGSVADSSNAGLKTTGYPFVAGGTSICINQDITTVVAAIGEPVSYFEAPSCAFGGLDKTYTYKGFQIETYESGELDLISTITLTDDMTATPEGIKIGSALADVTAAYGTATQSDDSKVVYTKDGMSLMFILKEGKVISVQYMME